MPRFYCNLPLEIGLRTDLPEEIARHIGVLRMKAGDTIEVEVQGMGVLSNPVTA